MLTIFLSTLHIIACAFLILVVLLQQGRSGGLGSAFGAGASQQVFGGRGAGNLLTRLTTVFAGVFMATSMSLAYLASAGDLKLKAVKSTTTTSTTNLPAPPPPTVPAKGPTPEESPAPTSAP